MNHKLLYIFGEEAVNESIIKIVEEVNSEVVFSFRVPKDYIYLPLLEEKLNQNNLLVCGISENSDEIAIAVKKCVDINHVGLTFDATEENAADYKYIIKLFSNISGSSVKKLTLKGINDKFTYEEIEKLFSETYRVLSFGSEFYLEYAGTEVSEYLLKGYLEYAGFVDVFPAVSPGKYEYGKIKISSKKSGLSELSKKPKKVLLNIDSDKPETLLNFTVFIRDLHNRYNNWDLYLVSEEWKFFDENIYLKYCSNEMPLQKIDYIIYIDDSNPIPEIDYEFKKIDGRKPDLFYSQENLINAKNYLEKNNIDLDDFFIIIDSTSVTFKESILEKFNSDFPYIVKIGFKVLLAGNDFDSLPLKDRALIMQSSSFYAGDGFNCFLADLLYIPCLNVVSEGLSNKTNYKREYKTGNYDVSIIIPAYNNFNFTKQCIYSIFKNHPLLNFEIILIDNGSTDRTKEFFNGFNELKNFKFIVNEENLGFAKASNQGVKIAESENLLFLNNDTVVSKGAIGELYYSLNSDVSESNSLNVAACGSLLLYPDKKIQQAGIMFDERLVPYNAYSGMEISGCKELDVKNAVYLRSFNAITAACLMVKKEIFEKAGGFDDGYINGFEDVDLCLKMRETGYKLIFNPKSIVFHFEEKTAGRKKHDLENINRFMEIWKHRYKRDNYILAEKDNLFISNKSKENFSKNIISFNHIKAAEDKIDELLFEKKYEEALKLCNDILILDKYNIKIRKKCEEIKKSFELSDPEKDLESLLEEKEKALFLYQSIIDNILKNNKQTIQVSFDENELYKIWIKYNEPSNAELEKQRTFRFKCNPKISIIMPVYNTPEEYLKKAIESVINQTYPYWELCIADDDS
ncbi:MAG: glycosyltransferase family 2 protein, partial [bacterium]